LGVSRTTHRTPGGRGSGSSASGRLPEECRNRPPRPRARMGRAGGGGHGRESLEGVWVLGSLQKHIVGSGICLGPTGGGPPAARSSAARPGRPAPHPAFPGTVLPVPRSSDEVPHRVPPYPPLRPCGPHIAVATFARA